MNSWWTYQQLRSSNLKTRLAVIAKLAEFKHSDCVEPLVFALKDKEPEIRSAAALALGQFSDKRVIELLIKQLSDPAGSLNCLISSSITLLSENCPSAKAAALRISGSLSFKANTSGSTQSECLNSASLAITASRVFKLLDRSC